jgi:type VI secretion system protein ImpE
MDQIMSAAQESFRAGDLAQSLAQLQAEVRQHPSDPKLRVFLAQLLMVLGQWDRALNQLQVLEEMDASHLPMVRTYQTAIACERLRQSVFAGERSPLVFGDPTPWLALLIQSLSLTSQKHYQQASDLRATALEQAPTTAGTLNGTEIQWIADADSRLGPVLEVLINGKYYWMPFERLTRVVIEVPSDVRDLVWTPAQLTLANGGEVMALIPTRYPGSEAADDSQIRMARRTDWQSVEGDTYLGLGQRVLTTDSIEVGLLETRELVLSSSNG